MQVLEIVAERIECNTRIYIKMQKKWEEKKGKNWFETRLEHIIWPLHSFFPIYYDIKQSTNSANETARANEKNGKLFEIGTETGNAKWNLKLVRVERREPAIYATEAPFDRMM